MPGRHSSGLCETLIAGRILAAAAAAVVKLPFFFFFFFGFRDPKEEKKENYFLWKLILNNKYKVYLKYIPRKSSNISLVLNLVYCFQYEVNT